MWFQPWGQTRGGNMQRHMLFRSIVLAEGHFSTQQLFSIDPKPTSLTGRRSDFTLLYCCLEGAKSRPAVNEPTKESPD